MYEFQFFESFLYEFQLVFFRSFQYQYSSSIYILLSFSLSISFTESYLFSLSFSLSYWNITGVVSFVLRTAIIYIFLSDAKCDPICPQTCAHSGIEPSRSAKPFLQGGPKSSKKIRITSIYLINY